MKSLIAIAALALTVSACNLPSVAKFKYIGWHECDPERTIPGKPLTKAFCLFEEDNEHTHSK